MIARKFGFSALVLLLALTSAREADAGLLALWDFNDATNGVNSQANTSALFSVDQGTGQMSSNFAAANITAFAGTTNGAVAGDSAGQALAVQDGTGNVNAGAYLQFSTSTVGQSAVMVSFAIQATATGFQSDQFEYTTDGMNYLKFGNPFTPISSTAGFGAAGGLVSFDLTSIAGLNNDANAGFRIIFNLGGVAGSSAGNNRIDNLLIQGTPAAAASVPEPASMVLLGLGLAGSIAVAARRKSA